MKTEKYNVTGMTCAACQANVSRCVSKLEGVEDVNVSLLANSMTVSYDESRLKPENIIEAVKAAGTALPAWRRRLRKKRASGGKAVKKRTGGI